MTSSKRTPYTAVDLPVDQWLLPDGWHLAWPESKAYHWLSAEQPERYRPKEDPISEKILFLVPFFPWLLAAPIGCIVGIINESWFPLIILYFFLFIISLTCAICFLRWYLCPQSRKKQIIYICMTPGELKCIFANRAFDKEPSINRQSVKSIRRDPKESSAKISQRCIKVISGFEEYFDVIVTQMGHEPLKLTTYKEMSAAENAVAFLNALIESNVC